MTYTPTKWVNGGKPAINAENLNKIEEALAQLFEMVSVPDITETTSTTQPNSHAGRENILEIGGVTEQDSTAGNQLWNGKYVTNALNKEQDNFVADTTMAGNISMPIVVGKRYSLSINGTLAVMRYAFLDADGNTVTSLTNASTTVLAPEGATYMKWRVNGYHAETDKVMLNEGTTALPYEKYTGGQPAPNPSYPMEIKKSVVNGVRTHGKNFYYADKVISTIKRISTTEITYDGNNIVVNKSNGNLQERMGVIFTAQFDGEYTLSCEGTNFLSVGLEVSDTLPTSASQTNEKTVFAKKGQYLVISCTLSTSFVGEAILSNIQVEEGTVATEYEPYTESSYTFSQPIELYGRNGVQDIIAPQDIKSKFAKRIFDGSENWKASTSLEGRYYIDNMKCANYGSVLCTHAKGIEGGSTQLNECYINTSNQPNGRFLINTSFATVDEWKAHLAENPMEVVYELAEEVVEELPIADQIGLNSLASYDGITYVEFDSEIQPTFKAEYGTSKVGGYTLEAMLAGRNGELRG